MKSLVHEGTAWTARHVWANMLRLTDMLVPRRLMSVRPFGFLARLQLKRFENGSGPSESVQISK